MLICVCKNVLVYLKKISPVFFLHPVYAFFLHIERNHGHTTLKRSNHINFLSDPYIKNHDLCHIDFENNDISSCNQTIVGGSQVECFEGSQVFHPLTRRFARTLMQLKKSNININGKHKYRFFKRPVQSSALNSESKSWPSISISSRSIWQNCQ